MISQFKSLPKNWILTKVEDICTNPQYGYTTKASQGGNLKLLRTTDITSGRINWNKVPYCTKNPDDTGKYLLKDGDIVISRAGSVGVSYLIKDPEKAIFASYLIRFKPLINKRYFKYFLDSPFYWNSISEKKLGIAVPNVNANKLKSIIIPLSPLEEQYHIVQKIEELFSDLDKAAEDLKKIREQLKIYRQAVLKAAFEGKLTEKWRVQNSIELLFEEVLLKDITDIIMGQSPPSSTYNTNKVGLPFYQGKKEFGDLFPTPEKYCSEPKKIAESNDILISVRAPVGPTNICKEKSCIGRGLAAIRTKGKIKKYYLFYYLKYFIFNLIEKSTGTTFNAISKDTLEGFKVLLFSLLEQQQIIQEIESRLSVCDKVEKTVEQNLSKIKYLRQSILKKAFEGKLVSQDPNDLPACELLKQIKIKKDKMSKNGK
jgi:type I restriction enzyme S subunit